MIFYLVMTFHTLSEKSTKEIPQRVLVSNELKSSIYITVLIIERSRPLKNECTH